MIVYGPHGADRSYWLPITAFAGAVVAVIGAYAIGRSVGGGGGTSTLILAGVTVAAFLSAAQTFVQQQQSQSLNQVYSWLLGGLDTSGWSEVAVAAPYVGVSALVLLLHRRALTGIVRFDGRVA